MRVATSRSHGGLLAGGMDMARVESFGVVSER